MDLGHKSNNTTTKQPQSILENGVKIIKLFLFSKTLKALKTIPKTFDTSSFKRYLEK